MKKLITLMAFVTVLTTAPGFGQHEDSHHGHLHHVSLFLGNTHDYHGEDAFTVGVDYEYRLHPFLGVGALIDHAIDNVDSTVTGVGLFGHPWRDLRLLVAAANEHHHGEDEVIVRVGAMYDFPVDSWSISPTVEVDFLTNDEQNWIYGLGIGRGF